MADLGSDITEKQPQDLVVPDFTITCGTKEFKVHRDIVCAESPFFHVVCNQPFKVRK
jgi:threonine dehydrogenase-like Zn-dependent dehydrogenase